MHQITRGGDDRDSHGPLLVRIRGEYNEMPDLTLTNWQACRLWNLDAHLCDDILARLVAEHFLKRTADGVYLRGGVEQRPIRMTGPDWLPREPDDERPEPDIDEPRIPEVDEPREPSPPEQD